VHELADCDPAGCTDDEYLALATADGPALEAVAALADSLRREVTNIRYTGCRFCAFAQRKGGATEVCMQGRIDPGLPVTGYADLERGGLTHR
jgi:FO synthase